MKGRIKLVNFDREKRTRKNINPKKILLTDEKPKPEDRSKYFIAIFFLFIFVLINAIQVNKSNICNS